MHQGEGGQQRGGGKREGREDLKEGRAQQQAPFTHIKRDATKKVSTALFMDFII
jgi:hypothetical protein